MAKLVSMQCVDLVKEFEGFYAKAYICPAGVPTIGYGTTNPKYVKRGACTKEEAASWLKEEIDEKSISIKSDLERKGVSLKQNEFDALASFAYNCGTNGLLNSTLYRNIVSGIRDKNTITSNFLMWDKVNGKALAGLTRRRKAEAAMFLSSSTQTSVSYCLEWQKWYNAITKTTTQLATNGLYEKSTQSSLDALLGYIKQSKKYRYCLEFQKFYNKTTQTSKPISEDGSWGGSTEKAYETMIKLIKGEY
jgi:GH24 family phage-related lysozyme (muramidase)